MNLPFRPLPAAALTLAGAAVFWAVTRSMRPAALPRELPLNRREPGRRIDCDGPANLRDLGGYQTADGRTVRWGVLYRSDHLGRLSGRDLRLFQRLGLATLIDFRSGFERADAPNRLPRQQGLRLVELPIFDDADTLAMGQGLRERIRRGDLAGLDVATMLTEVNRRLATEFTPIYRRFVAEVLAAGGRPLLFHCTAGKDRTGFAAAILLRLLGVPEATIVADYLRSHSYSLTARRAELLLLRLLKGPAATALVRGLLGVEAAYLQAAFAAIEQAHGSFDAYVRDGLGLGAADIAQLRNSLLER